MRSRDVLSTNLDHTGTGAFSVREQNAEVEVMREDYRLILPCPPQNFIISGVRLAYLRPMHGIKPPFAETGEPIPATDSCQPRASRRAKGHLQFFRAPSSIRQRLSDVILLQIRVKAKKFSMRMA